MPNDIIVELASAGEIIVEMASAGEIIVEISGMTYQSVSDQITALETDKADKTTVEAIGSEVTLARGTEPTLGARLDASDAQLADKASKTVIVYEPTLQSGFVGGSSGAEKVRVYKDSFGFVHIEGRVEGSRLFGSSNPVFTLPLEFRPKYVQTQTVFNNAYPGGFTKFRISTPTGVAFFESDPYVWTAINIHYYAGF